MVNYSPRRCRIRENSRKTCERSHNKIGSGITLFTVRYVVKDVRFTFEAHESHDGETRLEALLEHVAERPVIIPARVDLLSYVLVANIGR